MNKVLYVSDLDGTLLRSDEKISPYSCSVINDLVKKGINFSYATARSLITAKTVTKGLDAPIPVIVYNGAFIIDRSNDKMLLSNFFNESESEFVEKALNEYGIYPIVYSFINGSEKFSYYSKYSNAGLEFFLKSRKNDIRRNPVQGTDILYRGEIFYFTCIGDEEKLFPVYEFFKRNSRFNCIFQRDIYSGEQWLEILPEKATKANAVKQLKELLSCNKVVCFGDGKNDISMFQIADECYAVANAHPDLKSIATKIIADNDSDSVANWLSDNVPV